MGQGTRAAKPKKPAAKKKRKRNHRGTHRVRLPAKITPGMFYKLRCKYGLTLENAGRIVGVSFMTYHRYESGGAKNLNAMMYEIVKRKIEDCAKQQPAGSIRPFVEKEKVPGRRRLPQRSYSWR